MNIGPETNLDHFNSKDFAIYYPGQRISRFEEALEEGLTYNPREDDNSLPQAVSGFNNPSTFYRYLATTEDILPLYETLLPATVFTLCDLPGNDNYCVSNTAATKIGSRFINNLAFCGFK